MSSRTHQHRSRAARTLALSLTGGALVMAAALPSQVAAATPPPASIPAASSTTGAAMALPVGHFHLTARFNDGGGNWSSGHHTGLDFADPVGTPVKAPMDGVVVKAGPDGPYGNSIVIKHPDGLKTRYGHLNKILVKKGEQITRGQLIGKVGNTGNTTGPHLHFEVIKNGKPVNPEKYLWTGRTPSRG